ncbi:hypothetical protein C1I98_37765 [Spongiactinospora gelatinilytica]|uniref:JmjC domain-containing protein n=1 Tax=Spongiactinospora gelatinilytica TaxID=2666298 RepID=A0A2W2E750_9ACTN|nr:cupin domain-containing protein [Spongiactinospora gelatinilytica]PZG19882.1 hypothetical protein C1I98_37765 [Spongiactinospora gelatinilytica]
MITAPAEAPGALIAGTLWAAIETSGGLRRAATEGHAHFQQAFDPEWASDLPLPIDGDQPDGAPVALLDGREEFERHTDAQALADAYDGRHRTRVYEDIGRDNPAAWYTYAALQIGRLAARDLAVVCSVFQSRWGDESIGPHRDAWYGAIVQVRGVKGWLVGEGLFDGATRPIHAVTTKAGDVLLLPKGLPHTVSTPKEPGHSVHLAFAIDRDD